MNNYTYWCFHFPNPKAWIYFTLLPDYKVHTFQRPYIFLLDIHSLVKFYSGNGDQFVLWYICILILLGTFYKIVMLAYLKRCYGMFSKYKFVHTKSHPNTVPILERQSQKGNFFLGEENWYIYEVVPSL